MPFLGLHIEIIRQKVIFLPVMIMVVPSPFMSNLTTFCRILTGTFLTLMASAPPSVRANPAVDIPSLSVQEAAYGDSTVGTNTVSIEAITVHVSVFNRPPQQYTIQSIFLKRTGNSDKNLPAVDDVTAFEVTNCNDTFLVTANPIAVPPRPSSFLKAAPKVATTPKPAATAASATTNAPGAATPSGSPEAWQFDPRVGYGVRSLNNGKVLGQVYSSHDVESLCKSHPEILENAPTGRHLEAASLVQSLIKK